MCGDCVEPEILHIIEVAMSEKGGAEKDYIIPDYYLTNESALLLYLKFFWQEVPDIFYAISEEKSLPVSRLRDLTSSTVVHGTNDGNNIAFYFLENTLCHFIEHSLFKGFNENYLFTIKDFFGKETLSGYFQAGNEWAEGTLWENLWEPETFSLKESWEKFAKSVTENIQEAGLFLEEYLHSCTSEPGASVEMEFSSSAWNFLENSLPAIYYSLCMMARDEPDHPLLERLALATPLICDFAGDAYWLARKASIYCLQEEGISFVTRNFSNLRYLLIGYAVLKMPFPQTDLYMLRIQIQNQDNIQIKQIEQPDLLKIIDKKIGSVVGSRT